MARFRSGAASCDGERNDPRDPFVDGLDLPRRLERELVQGERERLYELNGEIKTTVGGPRRPHVTVTSQFAFADGYLRDDVEPETTITTPSSWLFVAASLAGRLSWRRARDRQRDV